MSETKPAASRGDHAALSLYQLIGAPLHALVDAEQQAAHATAKFIREVGFLGPNAPDPKGDDYGGLRMVRFNHERRSPDGRQESVSVEVPFLSLVPIPALQIRDAELDFFVKVVDVAEVLPSKEGQKEDPEFLRNLANERVQFRAAISRQPKESSRSSLEMQIRMKIRVEQADVPAGMAKLFNLLEQNVRATETKTLPPAEPEGHG